MTLTEFLLARIAEDEAVAAALVGRDVFAPSQGPNMHRIQEDDEYAILTVGEGRVLAECEAKRRIVDLCTPFGPLAATNYVLGSRANGEAVLRNLASIYADHPDYRDEWRA